ncbi:MAG: hypothetical protein ACP5RT_00855 [Candidatus Micrarchaeia archaeon]
MDEAALIYMASSAFAILIVLVFVGTYGIFSVPIMILAVLALLMIPILNYADFLIFPILTRILKAKIILSKNYYIPDNQTCIIKNMNGIYYATGYLTANLYNYIFTGEEAEGDVTELAAAPTKWERAMMNIKFPFRFNLVVSAQDVQNYREELEGKLGLLEFKLSREMSSGNPSQMSVDDLQRQIRIVQAKIDRLSSGEKPVYSLMYIESVAVGISEKAAMDALSSQLNQIQTIFNAFDLSITRVIGRELYYLYKFNYFIPTSLSDMTSLFTIQR